MTLDFAWGLVFGVITALLLVFMLDDDDEF